MTPDERMAKRVRDAVDELNAACFAAEDHGLIVEITPAVSSWQGNIDEHERVVCLTGVYRPIV